MTKDDNLSHVWKNDKFSSKGKEDDDDDEYSTELYIYECCAWLADWLTDWPPVRSDGKQYIKEIVSYNHVVPLFWIYEESLGSELFFQHIFKFFETNRNQRIVSPGYFKNSKNIWGWGNQMATYEKTKKKIIDGLTRH